MDDGERRQVETVLRGLPGDLHVREGREVMFGDTLCFTCGRSAVPGDMGEPGCPECARREYEFAAHTGHAPLRLADRPSESRPFARLRAAEEAARSGR